MFDRGSTAQRIVDYERKNPQRRAWSTVPSDRMLAPVSIRPAVAADAAVILELIHELAVYEREPQAVRLTEEQLRSDGFGEQPAFEVLLATRENQVLGMALYYPCYSTWNGKSVYLEDLVVREFARGTGVGKALMAALASETLARGATQMRWQVLDWNTPAIDVYKHLGAELDETWINGRLDVADMHALTQTH